MRKKSALLLVVGMSLSTSPVFAGYGMVNGTFSDNAYGGGGSEGEITHPFHGPERSTYSHGSSRYYYDADEGEMVRIPKPRPVSNYPKKNVQVAALIPETPKPQEFSTLTGPKEIAPLPEKRQERLPEDSDAALQNALIEKVLVERAYAIRKAEGIKEWSCMSELGKQMLAHIEAQFGKVDITTDGTCANRTIAGTGTMSQHAYGRAIDMHPGKGNKHSKKEILEWLLAHRHEGWLTGVMTYRDMSHIHVEVHPGHGFVALNH